MVCAFQIDSASAQAKGILTNAFNETAQGWREWILVPKSLCANARDF
jgi:hypothetical protein